MEQSMNGITRYIAVGTTPSVNKPQNVPPLAQQFVGEPKVTADVFPSGRVNFYVVQEALLKPRNVKVNDIHKVTVSQHSKPRVRRYPKPIGLTDKSGPGAPFVWPRSKEISSEVLSAIEAAAPELLKAGEKNTPAIAKALNKLGIVSISRNEGISRSDTVVKPPAMLPR